MKENEVYLNGELVDANIINPKEHKFIGTFRPVSPPIEVYEKSKSLCYFCSCGQDLWSPSSMLEHWIMGHFDRPQYITI